MSVSTTYRAVVKCFDLESPVALFIKKHYNLSIVDHEASILRRLEHYHIAPRVVGVMENRLITVDSGCPIYLPRGQELCRTMGEENLKKQASRILEILEREKIKHNDLYGENIIIDNSGTLRILDFGLATTESVKGLAEFAVDVAVENPKIFCSRMTDGVLLIHVAIDTPTDWDANKAAIENALQGLAPSSAGPEGANKEPGYFYHGLPFREIAIKSHRPFSTARTDKITAYLASRRHETPVMRGVDIGCANGGVSFELARHGYKMTGVDYDPQAIRFAQHVEALKYTGCCFECREVNEDFAESLRGYDFAVWLSSFMWVAKSYGVERARAILRKVSERVPILFFDTAQGGADRTDAYHVEGSEGVKQLLGATGYDHIECLGVSEDGYHRRNLFVCF